MDSPFKAASASAAEPLGPLTGRTAASRQTTHVVADSREWRDGYRRHLIAKSVPPHEAADLAAKVAFRPDLFPFPHAVPHLARAQAEQAIETRCSEVVQHTQPKRLNKLLAAAHEIATIPPTGNDFVLTHAVLCQVGLPRSKVEGREFHRRSGDMWINVQAGWLDEGRGAGVAGGVGGYVDKGKSWLARGRAGASGPAHSLWRDAAPCPCHDFHARQTVQNARGSHRRERGAVPQAHGHGRSEEPLREAARADARAGGVSSSDRLPRPHLQRSTR